jgi:hypothetical protein
MLAITSTSQPDCLATDVENIGRSSLFKIVLSSRPVNTFLWSAIAAVRLQN